MKVANTFSGNVTIKQLQKKILFNTKGQHVKESNTLADNAPTKQVPREILLDMKGQYMKESNTQAGKMTKNFL